MNEILPSVGDDAVDFYEGRSVYHLPWWDGFQHHVAAKDLTTRELCLEMKRILEDSPMRMYLDRGDFCMMKHFIQWFTSNNDDVPYQIWIDTDEETNQRVFFYETFRGVLKRFVVGAGMSIPKESLRASQTALPDEQGSSTGHIHIQYEKCQLGGCGKDSTHRIPVRAKSGATTSLDVCDDHFKTIEAQRVRMEEDKERKRLLKAEKAKFKIKIPRKKKSA